MYDLCAYHSLAPNMEVLTFLLSLQCSGLCLLYMQTSNMLNHWQCCTAAVLRNRDAALSVHWLKEVCVPGREGRDYVLQGHKWWASGAMDPRCAICIFMGKTDPTAPTHKQQSMILVPMNSQGVNIVRPLTVFGYDDAPHGHAEVVFKV